MDLVVGENAGGSSTSAASWRRRFLLDLGESGLEAALQTEDFSGYLTEKRIELALRIRIVLVVVFGELETSDPLLD